MNKNGQNPKKIHFYLTRLIENICKNNNETIKEINNMGIKNSPFKVNIEFVHNQILFC